MLKLLKIIEIKENFSPKNGNKKTLYGITNIKKTTQNGKLDNSSVISNKSSFYSDNITQSNDNVKLPSTKDRVKWIWDSIQKGRPNVKM